MANISIFDQSLKEKPQFVSDFSIANEIPHDSPTPWYNDSVILPNNINPQYIALQINYYDPILKESYYQIFYMKWDGVKNGITHPDFVQVSIE